MEGYGVKKKDWLRRGYLVKGIRWHVSCNHREKEGGEREREKERGRKKTWGNIMWATKMHRRLGTMMLRTTCVISFYYSNSYTHSVDVKKRDAFIQRRFYTETLLHTDDAFTHRHFYTQTLSHRDAFTRTETFTHRNFYTQTLLRAHAFTHGHFYTQTFWHTDTFTQAHLHAETLTPRRFSTQMLLHTDRCTHRCSYRQNPLHTGAFTGRRFCNTYQHEMMLSNRSETSWLRSANLSAQHSAGHIPVKFDLLHDQKTSIKNLGRYQTGARATSEIPDCTIMRIVVHSYQDEIVCHKNQCKTISTEERCREYCFQGIPAFTWGSDQTILV